MEPIIIRLIQTHKDSVSGESSFELFKSTLWTAIVREDTTTGIEESTVPQDEVKMCELCPTGLGHWEVETTTCGNWSWTLHVMVNFFIWLCICLFEKEVSKTLRCWCAHSNATQKSQTPTDKRPIWVLADLYVCPDSWSSKLGCSCSRTCWVQHRKQHTHTKGKETLKVCA